MSDAETELAVLRQALDLSGTGFVLTDPALDDNPIVYVNESFLEMTGYDADEILGRNCRFLQGESTDPLAVARLREAIAHERPVTVELVNHRKDGTPFFNELHVAPVRDRHGETTRFVGVQLDVTEYRVRDELFAVEQRARRAAEVAGSRNALVSAAAPTPDAQQSLRATLETLARLSVPFLGDVCLVKTFADGEARRVAAAAVDPELERRLLALPAAHRVDAAGRTPISRVLRGGRVEAADAAQGPAINEAVDGLLAAHDGHPARRWLLVPLRIRGRTAGVLALGGVPDAGARSVERLSLAEDLAARAALAIDNAQLREQQLVDAETLRAGLRPTALPAVEGLELAVAWRPAGAADGPGSDFYDVLVADGGTAALTLGGVTGRGVGAAALTGRCRQTLRATWRYEQRPAELLRALNAEVLGEGDARGGYATATLATLVPDGHGRAVEVVCAGRPALRILGVDGRVRAVGHTGTTLGWRAAPELTPARDSLLPGETLVAFSSSICTDDGGGALGAEALDAELGRAGGLAPDAVIARLESAALRAQPGRPADDLVLLAARVPPRA